MKLWRLEVSMELLVGGETAEDAVENLRDDLRGAGVENPMDPAVVAREGTFKARPTSVVAGHEADELAWGVPGNHPLRDVPVGDWPGVTRAR